MILHRLELADEPDPSEKNAYTITVPVHAATTPPFQMFPLIAKRIFEFQEKICPDDDMHNPIRKKLSNPLSLVMLQKMLLQTLTNAGLQSLTGVNLQVPLPGPAGEAQERDGSFDADFFEREPWEQIADLTWLFDSISPEQGTALLKQTLSRVQHAIDELAKRENVFIVVLIDEVSKLSGWGQDLVLQAWRHAIENEEYSRIRWVISAARPIAESPILSPITNVFKEYNVGSLSPDECERLLDSFGACRDEELPDSCTTGQHSSDRQSDVEQNSAAGSPSLHLRPILTFLSRGFLRQLTGRLPYFLQVCLYHLFERATRVQIPIVNRRACEQILLSHVLPEVSDFLESQWRQIPRDIQGQILHALERCGPEPSRFMKCLPFPELHESNFPSRSQKILVRSGLKGNDEMIIAPIVALWLLAMEPFEETTSHRSTEAANV